MVTQSTGLISVDLLTRWTATVLERGGASTQAAEITADALVDSNRRGIDSHGVQQLSFYLPWLRAGRISGSAHPERVVEHPAAALIDGHNGLGIYVGTVAMRLCCEKAAQVGAAVVAVRNSSHFAAASWYTESAVRAGCIGVSISNSDPGMAPMGALRPILGTNPIAIAAPGSRTVPIVSLDMATSVAAQSRVVAAAREAARIPPGWAIGSDGLPTEEPDRALQGSMLPMGGHKGFALAYMIDVLAGCLSGARISPEIKIDQDSSEPLGTGHLFIAIHLESLCDSKIYARALEQLETAVHETPRAAGIPPFLTPGERESNIAVTRQLQLPLSVDTVVLLEKLGKEFGAEFPRHEVMNHTDGR